MAFSDYAITNSGNSTISGINVGESCPPGNLNNAIRQLATDLRVAIKPALDPVLGATDLASARAAFGVLGSAGGKVTGPIVRDGAGSHLYWSNSALAAGAVYLSPASGGNPTSAPGEIWFGFV